MAEGVVDRLEVVDVEHQHGALRAVALDALHVAVEFGLELAAVHQAGQRVVVGHELQPSFEAFAVGHVEELPQQPWAIAGPLAQERCMSGDVHSRPGRRHDSQVKRQLFGIAG